MFTVYIIKNTLTKKYYIGYTGCLIQKRLLEHNWNQTKSTKGIGRWELIYREKFINKQEAIKRAVAEQSAAVKEQLKNEFKQRLKMEIRDLIFSKASENKEAFSKGEPMSANSFFV